MEGVGEWQGRIVFYDCNDLGMDKGRCEREGGIWNLITVGTGHTLNTFDYVAISHKGLKARDNPRDSPGRTTKKGTQYSSDTSELR